MAVRVVVVDPVHHYRMGVVAALQQAGLEAADGLGEDADLTGVHALVVSVREVGHLSLIRALRSRGPRVAIVALVSEDRLDDWMSAIGAGADAVVHRTAHPDLTLDALQAALKGMTLVPTDVVRSFVEEYRSLGGNANANGNGNGDGNGYAGADARDVQWLRRLAEGTTVAKLAKEACYSEREVYRILSSVYERLGARNRTDALMKAAKLGLLD